MTGPDHVRHMRRALELAGRGWGAVNPNPLVGAVVVRDGAVVGEGWHEQFGGPHAEVQALRAAGDAAAGATLYVTLEPCTHTGKTPPCTRAIIDAGIAHVIFAAADPNPLAGGGARVLQAAGVHVTAAVEQAAARALNAAFFFNHEHRAPWFALKLATSIDGRIAARAGERTAITGSAARVETHRLRAGHDAVLVGIRTALIDDPLLTVRDVPVRKQPVRIVLDSQARLPVESRLVRGVADAPVLLLCGTTAPPATVSSLRAAGVTVVQTETSGAGVLPAALNTALRDAGIGSVLIEGGSRVAGSLLTAGLIRRLHMFIAPIWLGRDGVPAFAVDAPVRDGWSHASTTRFGEDLLLTFERLEAA